MFDALGYSKYNDQGLYYLPEGFSREKRFAERIARLSRKLTRPQETRPARLTTFLGHKSPDCGDLHNAETRRLHLLQNCGRRTALPQGG
jgi:hypothetical protein